MIFLCLEQIPRSKSFVGILLQVYNDYKYPSHTRARSVYPNSLDNSDLNSAICTCTGSPKIGKEDFRYFGWYKIIFSQALSVIAFRYDLNATEISSVPWHLLPWNIYMLNQTKYLPTNITLCTLFGKIHSDSQVSQINYMIRDNRISYPNENVY